MYDNPPPTHCSLCDLGYAPSDAGDRRWHATYHARVDKLAAHLGRWPAGYSERERQKEEGRRLLDGANLAEKLRGADLVLTALYDREALQRLYCARPGQPPSFTNFLRTVDLAAIVGEEMAPHVRRQHGLHEKRRAQE
jgi:hypothetical protein